MDNAFANLFKNCTYAPMTIPADLFKTREELESERPRVEDDPFWAQYNNTDVFEVIRI